METIVYLWDFRHSFNALKNYSNYKKIIIVEEVYKRKGKISSEYFDQVYVVNNICDRYEVLSICEKIAKTYRIKAILASVEKVVEIAGFIRTKLGIPGMTEVESLSVRNKSLMKQIAEKNNIKTAKSKEVFSYNEIINFVKDIGFPIILKPLDGAGTINTFRISNYKELESRSLYLLKSNESILIEQFIVGREFHCDSIVINGEVVFSSIGEYLYNLVNVIQDKKPLGSIIYPDKSNKFYLKYLKEFNNKIIKCFKIKNSICHIELFLTSNNEIYFGEIATRIGGGKILPPCINNTHGINLYDAFIDTELNNFTLPQLNSNQVYTGVICFPSSLGTINTISTKEDLINTKGLIDIKIFYQKGQQISDINYANGYSPSAGYALIESSSYTELKNTLIDLYSKFQLELI